MRLTHVVAPSLPLAFFLFTLALINGCANNTYVVAQEMANQGYMIWYPAETGLEPGQIWLYDGTLRALFAERPEGLSVSAPKPANLSIVGLNDARGTLNTSFTEITISKAGPFAAELIAGTVKTGTFRIAGVQTVQIDLGNPLLENARKKYGSGYAKALDMVHKDTPGLVLIAAVVQAPRIDYKFYCDDPFKLIDRLPRIRDMIHAKVDTELLNDHEIRVTFTPAEFALTIGVTPVRGGRLLLTTDQARAALGHDLSFAVKQSYALRVPVPNIVAAPDQPVILPNDTDAQVVTKYLKATTAATRPSATTQSGGSGRLLMQKPETRPSQPKN